MQSLNEELTTVNAELQEKNEELDHSNQEMKNFLDSLDIPVIFVDNDLRVKQFTEAATEVVNLIDTDIGRPLGQVTSKLDSDSYLAEIEAVVRRPQYKEIAVRRKDGASYRMRLSPYRNVDRVMEGVLVAFIDMESAEGDVE